MSNPFLVQVPFAYQGNKNTIQLERQQSQDEEDATYKAGFPPVTMAKEELGGKPPKGLDFNGIFYELSSPIAHYCKGGRIYFDQEYANAIDGYPKGHIVASNDHSKDFISLIDNNTLDPNSNNITGYWAVYSGQGSIPTASSTISGTVKLINNLNSQAVDAALTAAQGKKLQDEKLAKTDLNDASTSQKGIVQLNNTLTSTATNQALTAAQGKALNDQDFGVNQTVKDISTGFSLGANIKNTSKKAKTISIFTDLISSSTSKSVTVYLNDIRWGYMDTASNNDSQILVIVPVGASFRVEATGYIVGANLFIVELS